MLHNRRRISPNIFYLAALPIAGLIGWIVSRIFSRQGRPAQPVIPISGQTPVTKVGIYPVEVSGIEPNIKDMGPTAVETKYPRTARRRTEEALSYGKTYPVEVGEAVQVYPSEYAASLESIERNRPIELSTFFVLLIPFLIFAGAIIILALYHTPTQPQFIVPGGNPAQGRAYLQSWGCGSCHTIAGVSGANGVVGPSLNEMSKLSYIAGRLQNSPDNLMLWIMDPQRISPGVDMPNTGVPANIARDMAAYLYSIK